MDKEILYNVKVEGTDKVKDSLKKVDKSANSTDEKFQNINDSTKAVNSSNKELAQTVDSVGSGASKSSKGFKKMGDAGKTAFKAIGSALKAAGIGLILSVITLIVNQLRKFDPIMDPIKKAFAVVSSTVKTIINNIESVGDLLKSVFGGNMDKAKQQWDELQTKVREAAEAAARYRDMLVEIEKFGNEMIVMQAELQAEADKYNAIADDATKSLDERRAAAQKAAEAEREIAGQQAIAAQMEVVAMQDKVKAEGGLAVVKEKNRDLYREYQEAIAAETAAIANKSQVFRDTQQREREIMQDAAEQELDYLVDGTKAHTDAMLERAANTDLSYKKREEALEEYNKTQEKLAEDQVSVLQRYTNKKINLDRLANESDAKKQEQMVRNLGLSEKLSTRLLEVIRERQESERQTLRQTEELKKQIDERDAERKQKKAEEEALAKEKEKAERERLREQFEQDIAQRKRESMSRTQILQKELEKKKNLLNKGIISQKEYNKEERRIEKKTAKIKKEAERAKEQAQMARVNSSINATQTLAKNLGVIAGKEAQAAKFAKGLSIAQTGVNIAKGFAKTASVGFPQNVPLLISYAAQTAGLLAQIKSFTTPEKPKFAEGGIIGGKPHSAGGTTFKGSDGSAFEAEKGEYLAIVNKRDANRAAMLDSINQRNGKSFGEQKSFFAQGGTFKPRQDFSQNTDQIVRDAIQSVSQIPVVVSEKDISDTQRRVNVLESGGNLK